MAYVASELKTRLINQQMCSEREFAHASTMQCEVWVKKHSEDPWIHLMCSKKPTRKESLDFSLS